VNVLDHLYRLACFAYAFHSAPRLSGGAAGPSRSARLCVQRTSSTPTWRPAPLSAQSSRYPALALGYARHPLSAFTMCRTAMALRSFSPCSPSSCAFAPFLRQVCRLIGASCKISRFSYSEAPISKLTIVDAAFGRTDFLIFGLLTLWGLP